MHAVDSAACIIPRLSASPPLVIYISLYHQSCATLPRAESCERFGHHQIDLRCTPITGANPGFQGCHIQLELWVRGSSLTMHPLGMEGVSLGSRSAACRARSAATTHHWPHLAG